MRYNFSSVVIASCALFSFTLCAEAPSLKTLNQRVRKNPHDLEAYELLGIHYEENFDPDRALSWYFKGLKANLDFTSHRFVESNRQLSVNRNRDNDIRHFLKTTNNGTQLKEKIISVYPEGSLSDLIQFVRFVPMLAERCRQVIFYVPQELFQLFKEARLKCSIVSDSIAVKAFKADAYLPLLALPSVLGVTADNMPGIFGYLSPAPLSDKEKVQARAKAERAAAKDKTFRVGIAWKSDSDHINADHQSIPVEELKPLASIPGVKLYSLEYGDHHADIQSLGDNVTDLHDKIVPFDKAAQEIEQLDVVVSVDSPIAHLAGALGKECLVMLPAAADWRWMIEGNESPFYSSMTLFRQETPGDWKTVVEEIKQEITDRATAQTA